MKKEKLSLKSIKNVMSRAEMRKITAGSGPCSNVGQPCSLLNLQLCCSGSYCPGYEGNCVPCFDEC